MSDQGQTIPVLDQEESDPIVREESDPIVPEQSDSIVQEEDDSIVPRELHQCRRITVEVMNRVLNQSEYIDCDQHRKLVVGVRYHVGQERKWVLKNCKLTIALDNVSGELNNRVKCIIIQAGQCENEIHCSRKPDGSICVMYIKTCMRLKVLNGIKVGINVFRGALAVALRQIAHDAMLEYNDHRMLEQNQGRQRDNRQDIEVVY